MKKILITIFLIQILLSSCAFFNKEKPSKVIGNWHKVEELSQCNVLIEKGSWREGGRSEEWRNGNLVHYKGIALDPKKHASHFPPSNKLNKKTHHILYIGPWQKTTLNHYKKSFPYTKSHSEEKQIRFFAYTGKNGGRIFYQFESMNEENKKIKEQKLILPKTGKLDGFNSHFDLCTIKWIDNFGYNAIAEVKSKNPMSKNYLVPTGRVIEIE